MAEGKKVIEGTLPEARKALLVEKLGLKGALKVIELLEMPVKPGRKTLWKFEHHPQVEMKQVSQPAPHPASVYFSSVEEVSSPGEYLDKKGIFGNGHQS